MSIFNKIDHTVILSFVSICGCITVSREHLQIEPGGKGSITISFDPADESGIEGIGFYCARVGICNL
ncbi:MAG: DUF1573 domain-containing protein [Spirochaetes bacterium]|nr:DUF1573 domain-containing protein [Spirochaetota bacterium]